MKKVICALYVILCSFLLSIPVHAAEADPYLQVLQQINATYGTDLQFDYVDKQAISIEEYQTFIESIAQRSAEAEASISTRQLVNSVDELSLTYSGIKTVTKDVWGGWASVFSITATYSVNENRISEFNNASINNKQPLSYKYKPDSTLPKTSTIDAGRTLTVTFTGTIQNTEGTISASNVKLYTEFSAVD